MKKPETVGFQLSAAVPIDRVGYVLKALFDNGCPPNSFDLKALVGGTNGHGGGNLIDAGELPQLNKPQRGAPRGPRGARKRTRLVILEFVGASDAVTRAELWVHLGKTFGEEVPQRGSIDTLVMEMVKAGELVRGTVPGVLAITKRGRAAIQAVPKPPAPPPPRPVPPPPPTAAPPGLIGHQLFVYSIFRAEPLKTHSHGELRKAFAAAGRAPKSVKVAMEKMRKKGLIKRVGRNQYQLAQGA
jgi:hypothetical protein